MSDRHVYFAVAEFTNPAHEPFAVIRIDISRPRGGGVEATVESTHWSKYVADQIAEQLNNDPDAYSAQEGQQ